MTAAEDYAEIAAGAYLVDPTAQDRPYTAGVILPPGGGAQQFRVIETATNPVTGFQAMAVVPLVNGLPDNSNVIVAYAGTNPADRADILADAQSVVGGKSGVGTQVDEAQQFAARVQAQYPGASMETVGHSLGGYLALYVAAENHWSSTAFNAPDPWRALSPQAKRWLAGYGPFDTLPLTNYVNEFDLFGNLLGNATGAAVFVQAEPRQAIVTYHDLAAFEFDTEDGSMLRTGAKARSMDEIMQNTVDAFMPGAGPVLGPILNGIVVGLRDPALSGMAGKELSRLVVAVDTIGALALAASIGGTAVHLQTIKKINRGLISEMEAVLTAVKSAAYLHPFITEADIEDCISTHRLHVHQNIDESAVAAVDALVDDHIDSVGRIADGVVRTVTNAAAQDAQWALIYSGR